MMAASGIGALYAKFGSLDVVHGVLAGVAAAAAGLVAALAAQVASPVVRRRPVTSLPVTAAGFAAAGLLHRPVVQTMLVLAPVSIVLAWRGARREHAAADGTAPSASGGLSECGRSAEAAAATEAGGAPP